MSQLRRRPPAAEEESRSAGHLPRPGHGSRGSRGPSQAALFHSFDSYFGGGSLSSPQALAVDQTTGDLYVLEYGDGCVSRYYGERGGPEALEPHDFPATGTTSSAAFEFRESPSAAQVAIDNSGTSTEGEIYVNSRFGTASGHARLRPRRKPRNRTAPVTAKTTSAASPRTPPGASTSPSTTPGSGTTPTTTRSPTPTSSAGRSKARSAA